MLSVIRTCPVFVQHKVRLSIPDSTSCTRLTCWKIGATHWYHQSRRIYKGDWITVSVDPGRLAHAQRTTYTMTKSHSMTKTTMVQATRTENQSWKRIAVIGAGASGLIASKELRQMGHQVTVYEQTNSIGGVWAYTDDVEDDPLGKRPDRRCVHGSMYANLRTNLPREVMGVADFPFDYSFEGSQDPHQYCSHEEVYRYLVAYAKEFDVVKMIRFESKVEEILPVFDQTNVAPKRWIVRVDGRGDEEYDAVVVCNGHYSFPRVPSWPGQDVFPGYQMHSHNYRKPDGFVGKRVVVVGAAFSGSDISQELLENGAAAVYLSGRNWEDLAKGVTLRDNKEVIRVNNVECLHANGSVSFVDGTQVHNIDVVMYATGYVYRFPFIKDFPGAPSIEDNRIYPLYQHVFPPALAPTLSFIGLPWKVVPFPQFQLQAQWVGACLKGIAALPPKEEMDTIVEKWYSSLEEAGVEKRYTHRMTPEIQGDYNRWLARQAGINRDGWPDWRRDLYMVSGMNRRQNGTNFRQHELVDAKSALDEFQQEAAEIRTAAAVKVACSQ